MHGQRLFTGGLHCRAISLGTPDVGILGAFGWGGCHLPGVRSLSECVFGHLPPLLCPRVPSIVGLAPSLEEQQQLPGKGEGILTFTKTCKREQVILFRSLKNNCKCVYKLKLIRMSWEVTASFAPFSFSAPS